MVSFHSTRMPVTGRADRHLFLALAVSILVAIANGSIFTYSLLSPELLKAPFSFSTKEINTVSTVGVIASYASLPTGQLYDRTSPKVTLLLGCAINMTGWSLMTLIFAGYLPQTVVAVSFAYAMSQLAASFFETGSVLPNLDAFSLHEGRIVAIQKTFMGLGSSVIATVFNAFFLGHDLRWYCLFLVCLSAVAGPLGAHMIRRPQLDPAMRAPGLNTDESKKWLYDRPFYYCYGVLAANLIFIFTVDLVGAVHTIPQSALTGFGVVAVVLALCFFPAVFLLPTARTAQNKRPTTTSAESQNYAGESLESCLTDGAVSDTIMMADDALASTTVAKEEGTTALYEAHNGEVVAGAEGTKGGPSDGRTTTSAPPGSSAEHRNVHGLLKNVRRPELWLMWYVSFATWGAMTLVNTNTTQIYTATTGHKNYDGSEDTVFVSLFGIGSALGRICIGLLLPIARSKGFEVWWFFPAAPVVMIVSLPLFFFLNGAALRLPFLLIGLATGVAWGATVLIIKRMFREAGRHYAFLYTAGMLTPIFFNLWLFTTAYEDHSRSQHQPSLSLCDGVECISMPVAVAIAANVVAAVAALVFSKRVEAGSIFLEDDEVAAVEIEGDNAVTSHSSSSSQK